jgi:L-alanine-DL-glutamate epimerase-like enolase superfamily enzyme
MEIEAQLLLFDTAFRLSYGVSRYRLSLSIRLSIDGNVGLGSGIYYACPPLKAYRDLQDTILPILRDARVDNLGEIRDRVASLFGIVDGGALYGVDTALWDLDAKNSNKNLGPMLGLGPIKRESINITEQIWAVSPSELRTELDPILARGSTQIKVKVNMGDDWGVSYLKQIRQICGSNIQLKIDPNGQYPTMKIAANSLQAMEEMNVELVEDPLPSSSDFSKVRELKNSLTSMKIMLDYNMSNTETLNRAIDNNAFDVINIKLSRVGGITRAIPLIQRCAEAGKLISIGCNEDIGPAMFGILHLSSVVPNYYGTEGVGWYRLNSKILKDEPLIKNGNIEIPNCFGVQPAANFEFQGSFLRERVSNSPSIKFRYSSFQRRAVNYVAKISHELWKG